MATALTVVVTGVWSNGEMSSAMVASAFNTSIPFGGSIIAICSLFFGFTSLVAWSYYGEQGLRYILGGRKPGVAYRILWCVLAFIGSIYGVKLIWDISDILIGLMVFPNIIGLFVLRRKLHPAWACYRYVSTFLLSCWLQHALTLKQTGGRVYECGRKSRIIL
jgi:Na+/alanine symporter